MSSSSSSSSTTTATATTTLLHETHRRTMMIQRMFLLLFWASIIIPSTGFSTVSPFLPLRRQSSSSSSSSTSYTTTRICQVTRNAARNDEDSSATQFPSTTSVTTTRTQGRRPPEGKSSKTVDSQEQQPPPPQPKQMKRNNNINNNGSIISKRTTNSPMQNRKLNQQITQQETALDLLDLLSKQKGALTLTGSGGILNSVNFSTAFHRIARHIDNNNKNHQNALAKDDSSLQLLLLQTKNDRSKILTDPRFALLLCSASEALLGKVNSPDDDTNDPQHPQETNSLFGAREMSNIAWAIAKLKLTPPQTVMPYTSDDIESRLLAASQQLRELIYNVAKQRGQANHNKNGSSSSFMASPSSSTWIPKLSALSGLVLDAISQRVVVGGINPNLFRLQEWANLLWALATTGRADEKVFTFIIKSLMNGMEREISNTAANNNNTAKQQQQRQSNNSSKPINTEDSNAANKALRPQEWSNSIWALATSGILGPEEDFLPFVANVMNSSPTFLESFKPQELSNTIWGVATILSKRPGQPSGRLNDAALTICRLVSRQVITRGGERFKSQELTNTAWALATLGYGIRNIDLESAERSDYKFLQSDDIEGDAELSEQAVGIVFQHAKSMLWRYRSQELNNLCWIMSRMDTKDAELMAMIGTELCNPRRNVVSQDLGTTVWGMASSGFDQPELYRKLVMRWTPEMATRAKPQELSNSVWALATADVPPQFLDAFDTTMLTAEQRRMPQRPDIDPVIFIFDLAAKELMRRPQQFKAQEIKDILWAFSRNGIRHPVLFRAMAEYIVGSKDAPGRGLEGFSVQAVGNTAWAYARQAQLGSDTIQRFNGKTLLPRTSGRLAHYIVLFTDVNESLIQELFYRIAETDLHSFDNLKKMKPQDIANTAWAFAIVGLQHTAFLDGVAAELDRRGRYFTPQEMTNSLWALATLDHCPPNLLHRLQQPIISSLQQRQTMNDSPFWSTRSISKVWKRQELANLAWIIAVFGEFPMDLVKLVYMGLIGVGDDPTPQVVTECHLSAGLGSDDGITPTVVMSLTYLQMMMDLDTSAFSSPNERIHLPFDFPDGWLPVPNGGGTTSFPNGGSPSRRGTVTTAEAEGLLKVHRQNNKQQQQQLQGDSNNGDLQLNRSGLQKTVSTALNRIGFDHVEEYVFDMATLSNDYQILNAAGVSTSTTGSSTSSSTAIINESQMSSEILSLDMANVQERIGIEVDGPGHFISNIDNLSIPLETDVHYKETIISRGNSNTNTNNNNNNGRVEVVFGWNGASTRVLTKRNGSTALKFRILEAIGWKIHNIPFWEWAALEDATAQDNYCRSLLNEQQLR